MIRTAQTGSALRITLDRPKALNALTHEMIRGLHEALDVARADETISVVFLEGAGEKAFCAGGDIVALRASALAGDDAAVEFWADEYALNLRIAEFGKPIVAFLHGVVMGGGIGLGGHASHRVVTEDVVMAMPEVGIGFTPDVGGSWLLSRAPGELGTQLALTGSRAGAADAVLVGLADVQVPLSDREALLDALASGATPDEVLAAHAVTPGPAPLTEQRGWIDEAYASSDAAAIARALEARPEEAARETAGVLRAKSPTSVSVTLEALRRARSLDSLAACLEQELVVSRSFLSHPDFVEGIRAQVVDKDRNPSWVPAALEDVSPEDVEAFFRA